MHKYFFSAVLLVSLLSGCAGMKVVDPNKPDNKGQLQVDYSGGTPKLVETYTCTMVGANGKRVYATGKSEEEARKEAIAKCQDQTLLSFCKVSKMSCEKN
ncbi:hypothetical protein [Bdellovibrio sp. ArHS]|uniref:hypothetical protein n=1 Tax=Bdellovibrio sp. ArHS TaxID=1569284 RepID=UPI000A7907D5|nr:hypothetical protein [Bdellovibrio sp. ArHS]